MAVNSIDEAKVATAADDAVSRYESTSAQPASADTAQQTDTTGSAAATTTTAATATTTGKTGAEAVQAAYDVWSGKYGHGANRVTNLTNAGFDYDQVQAYVNQIGKGITPDPTTYKGSTVAEETTVDTGPTEEELAAAQLKTDTEAAATSAASANVKSYADYLTQIYDTGYQQQAAQIDYKTQQSILDAIRTYEDSQQEYTDKYRNYEASLRNGIDNAALAARANGQFGGTATQNASAVQTQYQAQKQALALEQQQTATETARQVTNLRLQGEYDKADALIQQTQAKLSALHDDMVRVDENERSNWEYQNTVDRENQSIQRNKEQEDKAWYQNVGSTLLSMGLVPDQQILDAMGISLSTAQAWAHAAYAG